MESEYIFMLYKQYCKARGLPLNRKDLFTQASDFSKWLKEQNSNKGIYKDYLYHLGIDINNSNVAEVDKGKLDSIAEENTRIISLYADTSKAPSSMLIILDTAPIVFEKKFILANDIELFMTHNPYSEVFIRYWDKIQSNFGQSISIGVFGKNYDKDKKDKLNLLQNFLQLSSSDMHQNYDEVDDNYFYNITSSNKVLCHKLKR